MKVSIVHGGTSTEEAVSTRNAIHVEKVLSRLGYETELVLYDPDMLEKFRLEAPDVVFICVQGKGHGDGTIQALLDFLKIPYTGSKTLGAVIINNKIVSKELFERAEIPTPPWQSLSLADFKAGNFDFSPIGFPVVAKAPTQGGSFGIALIKSAEDIPKIESVFAYDDPILIEKFIYGRFVTLGLLRRNGVLETFPPVENLSDPPTPKSELVLFNRPFSYKPSDAPDPLKAKLDAISRQVFAVSRAQEYARVDFMISDEDGCPYVLEINAVPGLKRESFFPYGAVLHGITEDELMEAILQNAVLEGKQICLET
jgi:D-alanine-D-alanine ligase/UDP-N-acetylmuramate--alanine ligase